MQTKTEPSSRSPWALRTPLPALLVLLLALGGCGNLTAGGLSEAEVTVSGDAPDPGAAAAAWAGPARQDGDDDDDDEAEGELEADFHLLLENAAGERVQLTDTEVVVDVDIRGVQEVVAVQATIPSGRYTGLVILFSEIEVEIESGLVVGGTEITGPVDVELEAEDLEVVRALELTLEDGDRVEILVDLNAQDWLLQVDPDLRVVAEDFFANAISVRIR